MFVNVNIHLCVVTDTVQLGEGSSVI